MLNNSLMIYIYFFLFGYFFNEFKKFKNKYLRYSFIILIIFLTIIFLSVDVITNQGLTRSFWFHVQNNIVNGSYAPYFLILIYEILKVSFLFIIGFIIRKKINPFQNFTNNRFISLYLLIFFFIFNPSIYSSIKNSTNIINNSSIKKIEFEKNYFELKKLKNEFNNRDIIFISLESLERTFYKNKKLKHLNLKLLNRQDLIDFTNIEEIYGFTDWSLAGLVAVNCGLPILSNGFYSSYFCLSDLLSQLNYTQKLIQGSPPEFAGNGNFYKIHEVNNIIGPNKISKEILEKNLSYSHWGLHDHIVFNFALKKIIELEKKNNNYAIWLNTLDNHSPNGFLSDLCKNLTTEIKEQILKTAYCTDLFANKFINNIFENDLDKNNLIVVHSDHLLMGSPILNKYFSNSSERSNLFLIIDPYKIKQKKIVTSKGNMMDIPATIVDFLEGGKKFGLGKSLLNENQNNSLSNLNIDTNKILNKFKKKLVQLNKKVDLTDSIIILKKKAIVLNDGFEAKIPVFVIDDTVIQSDTDVYGKPREIFDAKLYNLTKKSKKFNYDAIANCYEVKAIINKFNISCDYTFIKSTDNNGIINLTLKPFFKNGNTLSISNNKNINIKISKSEFIKKIEELNEPVSFFSSAYKNFRYYVSKNLESNYPKLYPSIKKIYIKTKYIYLRLYFKIFLKSDVPKNFLTKNDTFIAHAGGLINGNIYTNSLEALNNNYQMGFKYFELDLKLTSDNIIVAVHDWDSWKKRTSYKEELPPTYKSFMKHKIDNKYAPLSEYEIKEWFLKRNDAYLITDKIDNFEILNNVFFNFKERLIVELFSDISIQKALLNKNSKILINQRILWQKKFSTKYLDILYSKKIKPYGFAVHNEKIYENPKFFKKAKKYGFKTYVYGMNDNSMLNNEKNVLCDLSNFIDGIYSDKNLLNKDTIENYCD